MFDITKLLSSFNVGISFVDTLLPIATEIVGAITGKSDSKLAQKANEVIATANATVNSISQLAAVAEGLIADGVIIATSSDLAQLKQVRAKLAARNDILEQQIKNLGA